MASPPTLVDYELMSIPPLCLEISVTDWTPDYG
jgi:hypothetical protein